MDAITEVIREAEEEAAVVELGEGDAASGGHHEEFADGGNPGGLHGVHEYELLGDEGIHERGEGEERFGVRREAGKVEKERVACSEAGDLASTRKTELSVELAGVSEGDAVAG